MTQIVSTLNSLLAIGTIGMLLASAFLFWLLVRSRSQKVPLLDTLAPWALPASFLVALSGTILALVYSDIFGFLPCGLCWLERIALFPLVIIFGIAVLRKDAGIKPYVLGLATFGLVISFYHHLLQMGLTREVLPCPATGGGDCSKRILFEFGFITFPLMAFASFLFLSVLAFLYPEKQPTTPPSTDNPEY